MSTVASIFLYALAAFAASMIGIGAGHARGKPTDKETENNLLVAGAAFVLFFGLAVALQVFA